MAAPGEIVKQDPRAIVMITQAIKRIKNGTAPKYPVFYDIGPLVATAFDEASPRAPIMLDRLALQLRLTTLMRSVKPLSLSPYFFLFDKWPRTAPTYRSR